jgi:cytoskeletal protein CcmA (bactofilin family)
MFLVLAVAAVPFAYDGSLRPGQKLTVRDVNGTVRVRTGDRLSIRANKHAERGDPNEVAIHVENRADGIVVCVRYPPNANRACDEHSAWSSGDSHNDTAVDFDITVPHGITLDAKSINGSVDAINDGPTDAESVNGSVRVEGRDVRKAASVNGSVEVHVLDRVRGTLSAKTVNGSIDVSLPPGSGVSFDARTLTGTISANGITVDRPQYGPGASAHGTVGDGALRIDAKTINGSITLHR